MLKFRVDRRISKSTMRTTELVLKSLLCSFFMFTRKSKGLISMRGPNFDVILIYFVLFYILLHPSLIYLILFYF